MHDWTVWLRRWFCFNEVKDGTYLLNLQIAFENDASPSKPVLYAILKDEL
jgi:hypothetical protein